MPTAPSRSAPPLTSRLRPGFLATFTVVGIGALVVLAVVLSRVIGDQIRNDQLNNARSTAQLLAQSAIAPTLLEKLGHGPVDFRALDRVVIAAKPSAGYDTVVVLTPAGRVVYANDHRLIGRRTGLSPAAAQAARGTTSLRVQSGPTDAADLSRGAQIAVAVPIQRPRGKRVAAVVEVRAPWAPVQSVIDSRTRNLKLVLFGGGLLLFTALWPRLLAASRALKRQSGQEHKALVRELRRGLDRDELVVHFQPKVSLRGGQVTSMEALVRWQHPKRGLLSPDQFMPAAMVGELTGPLTIRVADMALGACRAWRETGIEAGVSINLAAGNALDDQLPAELHHLLARWALPAEVLGVDITESAIAADPEHAGKVLGVLDEMGLRIAIDDFGTGYSSLAGLRSLPVDELKIDRSFVADLATDPDDAAIVQSMIGLAHLLGIEVIAEGVEDEATVRHLTTLGCDQAQGYYFARPLQLPDLLAWLSGMRGPAVETAPAV